MYPLSVLLDDRDQTRWIRPSRDIEIFRNTEALQSKTYSNLFIVSTMNRLPGVGDAVRASVKLNTLKALIVRLDTNAELIPYMLKRARIRTMQKTLIYSDPAIPRRILSAWRMKAEDQLIANASIVEDSVIIVSCSLKTYELPFEALSSLKKINRDNRGYFEIDEDGSFLYWPRDDVHIDLDAARYATDEGWRAAADLRRVNQQRRLGEAIRRLRERQGLRQCDIPSLSSRQLSRVERGAYRASHRVLSALSEAHRMSLNDYLNAIASENTE